jgi:PAS domain S-box-containing protein
MDGSVRVLHVDDDRAARDRAASALREVDERFEVVDERTVEKALARLENGDIECIVSEVDLPDGDGLSLLADRGRRDDPVPFVLFTDSGSEAISAEAFTMGAADYRRKGAGSYAALARWLAQELDLAGGSVTDITDQKRREQATDRERERFSELFDNFPEPTIAYALNDRGKTVFRAVNDAFEETFAFEEEAVLGERVNGTIVPEDQRDESTEIDRKVESGEMIDREVQRLTASGSRTFNLRNIPVSPCGDIDGFATYTDITERRLRERELGRYETIVKTMPMGVFVVDEAGTIVNANKQAAEIIGYEVEDILDKPFLRLVEQGVVDESVVEEYTQSISELLSSMYSKDVDVMETDVTRADGETRSLEVYTSLLPFEESFRGSVQVYHDVTERRQNERELRRQNERLEEFASIVSHDLRNPLNVAKGHLDLLERECDSEHTDTVAGALERMEALIGETLQLARQGEIVTETEPLALGGVTEGCWEMVATKTATLECPDNATVHGDPEHVKQLFENLFRNSVEHAGSAVTITVGVLDDGFYVADDGPGIPAEKRDQLFEAGYTTSQDGTGFGLSIVAEIVEAHDWSITVTEGESGGARFEITGVDLST